ncbi:aldehyde ferredoxin oxidoreductase family protein [Thermodesulfobacteriota bacterium]
MTLKGGYWGKFLQVDLTKRFVKTVKLDDEFARKYLGGVGFGNKILFDRVPAGTDPLSPENIIMWMTGPLNGTSFHGQKTYVIFKSPLTGNLGFAKHGGGMAWELKFAGWDGVIVTGRAENPVYIHIKNDDVEIRDASLIWGKDTMVTGVRIREETGDIGTKVSCCGPAGENMVRFASIMGELGKAAARTGGGAVMGSKNLKALAVRGTKTVPLADMEKFNELTTRLRKTLIQVPYSRLRRWGTCTYNGPANNCKNFQLSCWPEVQRACSAEAQEKMFWVRDFSCPGCPSVCFRRGIIRHGPFTGRVGESSEYDTSLLGLGAGVTDLFGFLNSVGLCDKLGLDGTSTGSVITWCMECYEKGILTREDLDGLELTWGNTIAMDKLIKKIAFREGIGNLLAEGTKRASQKIGRGSENYAMQIKGLEIAAWDPRGWSLSESARPGALVGTAIGYSTASRGGDHITDQHCEQDASGVCNFAVMQMAGVNIPKEMVNLLRLAVGWEDYTLEEYRTTNERLWTLRRLFNIREGMERKDDVLPERHYARPIPTGSRKGMVVSREAFEKELDKFYEARGWDKAGIPTKERLKGLGLEGMI